MFGSGASLPWNNHLKQVPEDARARIILANDYASIGREDDALRETSLAMTLRAGEATVLYNAACVFSSLKRKPEAIDALRKCLGGGIPGCRLGAPRPRRDLPARRSRIRTPIPGESA